MNRTGQQMKMALLLLSITPLCVLADWPMLAGNPQRSGSTSQKIRPPFERKWIRYFWYEGLMPSVQPVCLDDKLYLGTLAGNVYCLDAKTGQTKWKQSVGSPVLHTAATSRRYVYVPTTEAMVVLSAETGKEVWRVSRREGFWNAPVVHRDKVYIGGRDGIVYCFIAADGTPVWTYEAGAPLHQSPALDVHRGRLYITSEAMVVHAIDAASGEGIWTSQPLPGVTARGFYPVVAPDGTVLTNSITFYNWHDSHRPLAAAIKEIFGTEEFDESESRYPGTYSRIPDWRHNEYKNQQLDAHVRKTFAQDDYFQQMLTALAEQTRKYPAARCLFALDPDTGKEKYFLPVLFSGFATTQFHPPLVTPDGKVMTRWYTFMPSTYKSYQQEVNLAWLDTKTGKLSPVFNEQKIFSGRGLGLIADESCQLMVAGNLLLNLANHHGELLRWFDLSDPDGSRTGQAYQTFSHSYGVGIIHRLLRGQVEQITPGQEDLPRGWGVGIPGEHAAGNHNCASMPVVVSKDMVYWIGAGKLMGLASSDTRPPGQGDNKRSLGAYGIQPLTEAEKQKIIDGLPVNWDYVYPPGREHPVEYSPEGLVFPAGTKQNPDYRAGDKAKQVSNAQLDKIIFGSYQASADPQGPLAGRVRKKLIAATGELISQDQWMPYRYGGGKHPTDYLEFFTDPAGQLEALARAYPYLPADLQKNVAAYVEKTWDSANPVVSLSRYPALQGRRREYHTVPDDRGRVYDLTRSPGLGRAYAAWLWADRTGQWEMVRKIWPRLRNAQRYGHAMEESVDWGNAELAGRIALCRLAKRFEDAEALAELLPAARTAMRRRLAKGMTYHAGHVAPYQVGIWRGYNRWTYLSEPAAELIRKHGHPGQVQLVSIYLDRLRPVWFLARGPLQPASHEVSMQVPWARQAGFVAQALLKQADPADLFRYADIPIGAADTGYIHRLAMILEATER